LDTWVQSAKQKIIPETTTLGMNMLENTLGADSACEDAVISKYRKIKG